MARLTARRRIARLFDLIDKASSKMIPFEHIRMGYRVPFSDETIYEILSPITNTWQEMIVSEKCIRARVLPQGVCDLMDYYTLTKALMDKARDLQVFNEDLRPINEEEKRLFGVREGENNACFPRSYYGINRSYKRDR